MKTSELDAATASVMVEVDAWGRGLDALMRRVGRFFARWEPRVTAKDMVDGLLSQLPRKNCWTMSEYAGHRGPDRMQHLLARAKWDEAAVRGEVRDYLVEHLTAGVDRDEVVLVVDETGDQKKGDDTIGTQRQYSGTCGRIENCQCATRRRVVFPVRLGGIGGISLGLMAYLDPKGEEDNSMPGNQWPCPGVWSGALGDPRDMAKAGLLEVQSPVDGISHPLERRLKPTLHRVPAFWQGWHNFRVWGDAQ